MTGGGVDYGLPSAFVEALSISFFLMLTSNSSAILSVAALTY
jgi:hypothetical protein